MTKLYAYRHQPIKGIYFTGQIVLTLFVRLPFWVLTSLPRFVFSIDVVTSSPLTRLLDPGANVRHGLSGNLFS